MKEIQVVARCRIHEGKLEAFKAAARACLANTREKDKGTLEYDWFFNPDKTECVVLETYRDSEAVLGHVENLGEKVHALLGTCDFSIELFGDVSPALRELLEAFPHRIYDHYFQGL